MIHFNNDTPDKKHEFYRTGQVIIQKQIECSRDASFTFNYNDMFPGEVIMKKPNSGSNSNGLNGQAMNCYLIDQLFSYMRPLLDISSE